MVLRLVHFEPRPRWSGYLLRDDKNNLGRFSSRGCNLRILHNSCVCKVPRKRGRDLKLANTMVNNEVLVI